MNENINLCEILKGHEGETFWNPLVGNIIYKSGEGGLVFFQYGNSVIDISYHGKDMNNNMSVFPSKDQRDWNKWIEEHKPRVPKTWSELVKNKLVIHSHLQIAAIDGNLLDESPKKPSPIEKSALALLKIHQLIEAGYGGNVTKEEWSTLRNIYQIEYDVYTHSIIITNSAPMRFFSPIAFHTKEQAEEFLSKPENVQLLKDYFMINNNE